MSSDLFNNDRILDIANKRVEVSSFSHYFSPKLNKKIDSNLSKARFNLEKLKPSLANNTNFLRKYAVNWCLAKNYHSIIEGVGPEIFEHRKKLVKDYGLNIKTYIVDGLLPEGIDLKSKLNSKLIFSSHFFDRAQSLDKDRIFSCSDITISNLLKYATPSTCDLIPLPPVNGQERFALHSILYKMPYTSKDNLSVAISFCKSQKTKQEYCLATSAYLEPKNAREYSHKDENNLKDRFANASIKICQPDYDFLERLVSNSFYYS